MVYCFQALLVFGRADRRDQVLSDLQSRVESKPRWGVTSLVAVTTEAGAPAIGVEARFPASLDRDDVVSRLESFATGVRAPQPGSWYSLHACRHDEGPLFEPCVITRRAW